MNHFLGCALTLALGLTMSELACAELPTTQQAFFEALRAHCGKAYQGILLVGNTSDDKFRHETLVMHVRECTDSQIKVPFHVGADRSRTWVISKTATGLRLKHDHRHDDGHADKITLYGGDAVNAGTAARQEFPADQYSKALFTANDMAVSNGNIWSVAITPQHFRYGLKRVDREFLVQFDLRKPVATPPAPWGHQ